jgi:multiple sugar transport system permease protein
MINQITLQLRRWSIVILTTVITIILIAPIAFMFTTSLKPNAEIFQVPPEFFPKAPTLDSYKEVLADPDYPRFFRNSYIISSSVAIVCIVLSLLAGYGFSRYRIRGGNYLLVITLVIQMFPGMAKVIPYFDMFQQLGLYDTYIALVIAHTSFALPFSLWMMKSYLDGIPRDLEEAAMVDGANRLQALIKIVAPLTLPGVIAVAVQAYLWSWNEYLFALILTRGAEKGPITLGIGFFFGEFVINWNSIMAVAVLSSLPLMIIFIFAQRYLVRGITAGAVK